jgi:CMP-N-acetylneuraminic acid synthetase
MTTLLAIVPARMGSKGVPGKNKALVGGVPLIEHTIAALEASQAITSILITSDDPDILDRYRDRNGIFLVKRPEALARDDSPTADAVSHALAEWERSGAETTDAIMIAQPTTPLRRADDIDTAFALFATSGADSLASACRAEGIRHPHLMYRVGDKMIGTPYLANSKIPSRRQDLEPVYQLNGAIYFVWTRYFRSTGKLRSDHPVLYEMPWERSVNIDTPGDLLIAKALIESGLVNS